MTPQNVSVTQPVGQAIDRVKRMLFQPFDTGKWFVIGFCAWLAHLGEGGFGGFNGGYNFGSPAGHGSGREQIEQIKDYVLNNLSWIVPLAVGLVVIGLAVGVVLTWLGSRGRFMFLHCVALDKAEVVLPWRKFAREGNSLFLFRLALGLVALILVAPFLVLAGYTVFSMIDRGGPSAGGVLGLVAIVLALIAVGIMYAVIAKLTKDFVVPIMFLQGCPCREGWNELLGLISANVGRFLLYLLFQIVLGMAIGAIILIVVIVTCCVAGCLLAIPYLGTVVLLPILIFGRSYSLYYLAQYGQKYDVFAPSTPPAPGTTAPPGAGLPVAPA